MTIRIPERTYLHFDRPFFGDVALEAVSNPAKVSTWSFMPFLHIELKKVRLKRHKDGSKEKSPKSRQIFYASHRDAALYYYYAEILSVEHEAMLRGHAITRENTVRPPSRVTPDQALPRVGRRIRP